jgi:hypothetical protein
MSDQPHNGRDQRGLFLQGVSGNPLGRPRGSRNRLGEQFISDLYDEWQKSGADALRRLAQQEDPTDYVRVVASVLPKQLDASLSIIDAELVHEQRTFMEAYRRLREIVVGANPDDTPLIEAQNGKDEA